MSYIWYVKEKRGEGNEIRIFDEYFYIIDFSFLIIEN